VVLLGQERALPLLQRIKDWIYRRGDWIVGVLSLLLAGYFGWQGIGGLVAG
jgi:predicted negative regulator of RcsB-dependent stress response